MISHCTPRTFPVIDQALVIPCCFDLLLLHIYAVLRVHQVHSSLFILMLQFSVSFNSNFRIMNVKLMKQNRQTDGLLGLALLAWVSAQTGKPVSEAQKERLTGQTIGLRHGAVVHLI